MDEMLKHNSDNNQQTADSGPQVVQYGHVLATEIFRYHWIQEVFTTKPRDQIVG